MIDYESMRKREAKIEQWVKFIERLASDEFSDMLRSVHTAASRAIGASEYEFASQACDFLEKQIEYAREGWIDYTVEEESECGDSRWSEVYDSLKTTGVFHWPRDKSPREIVESEEAYRALMDEVGVQHAQAAQRVISKMLP